ncbi:MAG: von Willebrand factor type A domain-containing protein, partial [bacterium]
SYTLTRQAIRAGQLPDPEVVRTEEIVNAFDYNDAPPDNATFRVYVEGAPSPYGQDLTLLRIGVKGRRLGREEQRPAMLTFLIDTSGSMMQPDRIGLARTALKMLLANLSPVDRIQIVSFDDHARIVLDPTPAAEAKKILAVFDALQCTGSTNLEDGMRKAYERAARAFTPGAENRVVIISDGVANLGTDEAPDILAKVESFRRQGITCSVFGVGQGTYNDQMLEQLANKGDGVYRFLDSEDEARRVFVDDLAATLHTIATDVKIQVEWNAAAVQRYRQLGYENRALTKQQFRDDTVDAGEVGSGQAVTALYELAPTAAASRLRLGTVRVRYRRTDTHAIEEIATPVLSSAISRSLKNTRPQFQLAACAAEFSEILRVSPYAAGSRFEDVARLLRPVAMALPLDARVSELLQLTEQAESLNK